MPVAADQIRAWFGEAVAAVKNGGEAELEPLSNKFMMFFIALNAVPLMLAFGSTWFYVLLGALAIYLPAKFLGAAEKGEQ